ncbi:hypothetical protein EV359DRAFT_64212 [Lentinula novae-zelandiae]|nr:hypothetical protein EV359DRAFT_64212 [Lentinula novae-zelandiae]
MTAKGSYQSSVKAIYGHLPHSALEIREFSKKVLGPVKVVKFQSFDERFQVIRLNVPHTGNMDGSRRKSQKMLSRSKDVYSVIAIDGEIHVLSFDMFGEVVTHAEIFQGCLRREIGMKFSPLKMERRTQSKESSPRFEDELGGEFRSGSRMLYYRRLRGKDQGGPCIESAGFCSCQLVGSSVSKRSDNLRHNAQLVLCSKGDIAFFYLPRSPKSDR